MSGYTFVIKSYDEALVEPPTVTKNAEKDIFENIRNLKK